MKTMRSLILAILISFGTSLFSASITHAKLKTHNENVLVRLYTANDQDGDGIPDYLDNCANTANSDQADSDFDRIGDVCDDEINVPVDIILHFDNSGSTGWYDSITEDEWTYQEYDLSEWAAGSTDLRIRFRLESSEPPCYSGWNIDDVVINGDSSVIWSTDFENPYGDGYFFTGGVGNEWVISAPDGDECEGGNPDPHSDHSPSGYMSLGTDNGIYGNGCYQAFSNSWAYSLPIDCTSQSEITLSFWRWLNIRSGDGWNNNSANAYIEIDVDGPPYDFPIVVWRTDNRIYYAKKAAEDFIRNLKEVDSVAIYTNDNVLQQDFVVLGEDYSGSSGLDLTINTINSLEPLAGSSQWDSLHEVIDMAWFDRNPSHIQAVISFSDGPDWHSIRKGPRNNSGTYDLGDYWPEDPDDLEDDWINDEVCNAPIPIFSIGINLIENIREKQKEIAYSSSGGFFSPASSSDIGSSFTLINEALINSSASYSCGNVTEIPAVECDALVALFNSTSGDNWTNNTNWLETLTPCDWHGVYCTGGQVTMLGLANNNLIGSIPPELSALENLQGLYLPINQLTGSIPSEFVSLTNLHTLNVSFNQLSGGVPSVILNLPSLQYLYLQRNQLTGNIPSGLGNLTGLKYLLLSENQFDGTIPSELGNLIDLEVLALDTNELTGIVPGELGNLTGLKYLYLNNNLLSEMLPLSLMNLSALNAFYFNETNLCEPSSAAYQNWLASIPDLLRTGVPCPSADLSLTISESVDPVYVGEQVEYILTVSNNTTTSATSVIVNFAIDQEELLHLDTVNTSQGTCIITAGECILGDLTGGGTATVTIVATAIFNDGGVTLTANANGDNPDPDESNNSITEDTGIEFSCEAVLEIPQTECEAIERLWHNTDGESWVDDTNWVQSNEPSNWFGVTVNGGHVTELQLRSNNVGDIIPPEIGNLTNLVILDLAHNIIGGNIPSDLKNITSLDKLDLSFNLLGGDIPIELGELTNLSRLILANNQLTGSIPSELGNLINLNALMLDSNQLTGDIPLELGTLTNLSYLSLTSNQLSGNIPSSLGNLSNLRTIRLFNNELTGSIPSSLGNLTLLISLRLNDNQLSGSIPSELGNLGNIRDLMLYNNQLSGELPTELGNLLHIIKLRISYNQLVGRIPLSFINLSPKIFIFNSTGLCEPADPEFQEWLDGISDLQSTEVICNTPPVAVDDVYFTDEDTLISVVSPGVLTNDSDADNDPLSAVLVTGVDNGTLVLCVDGSFIYTPDLDYFGTDTFTYIANDGELDSLESLVSIAVNPVNDIPIVDAGPDVTINEGEAFFGSASFSDPDFDTWTATVDYYSEGSDVQSLPINPEKTFTLSHGYPNDDGVYAVTVSVDDGEDQVSDNLIVTINNVSPSVDVVSVADGQDFVLAGLDVNLVISFNDPGNDTHRAVVGWGFEDEILVIEPALSPLVVSHKYQVAGAYNINISVTDDDGGSGFAVTSVTIVEPSEASQVVIDELDTLLANPEINPLVAIALGNALVDLEGANEGLGNNGALDKIVGGQWNAALVKIERAIQDFEDAELADPALDLSAVKKVLALTAKSIVLEIIEQAEADASTPADLVKIENAYVTISEGTLLLEEGEFLGAVNKFRDALSDM